MKDYCNLTINDCDTVENVVAYLHGVICVMNRFFTSPQSQAIYEMFVTVHYQNWDKKKLFDFLSDLMILTEDNSIYEKLLYHVRNTVQNQINE